MVHTMSPKKPKLTNAERKQRFVEMAKKVQASENLEDLDRVLIKARITSQKPSAHRSRRNDPKASS
jgi:hypothetical protein